MTDAPASPSAASSVSDHHVVRLLELLNSFVVTRAIHAVACLKLADRISEQPRSVEELAEETHVSAESLHRLLRTLRALDIFDTDSSGRVTMTPLAQLLVLDNESSLYPAALLVGSSFRWRAWEGFEERLAGTDSAFRLAHGVGLMEHLASDAESATIYSKWVSRQSELHAEAVLNVLDLTSFRRIVDVGGGDGTFLLALLQALPHADGILFDKPERINTFSLRPGVELVQRCSSVAGDFFQTVPGGGDLYILKLVIHDWDDEHAAQILSTVRGAMPDGATLVLLEHVVPDTDEFHLSKLLDLAMLAMTSGGRERTRAEYESLLHAAGFEVKALHRTELPIAIIEATAGDGNRSFVSRVQELCSPSGRDVCSDCGGTLRWAGTCRVCSTCGSSTGCA
jgi:hypothetical protein